MVKPLPPSDEVFIVHGRDDAAKIAVARLVERAGLKAMILHEQANGGRTIKQKFARAGRIKHPNHPSQPTPVVSLQTSCESTFQF